MGHFGSRYPRCELDRALVSHPVALVLEQPRAAATLDGNMTARALELHCVVDKNRKPHPATYLIEAPDPGDSIPEQWLVCEQHLNALLRRIKQTATITLI